MNPYFTKAKEMLGRGVDSTVNAYKKNLFTQDLQHIAGKSTGVRSFMGNMIHSMSGGAAKDSVVNRVGAYTGHPTWDISDKFRISRANQILKGSGKTPDTSPLAVAQRMRRAGMSRQAVGEYHQEVARAGRMRTLTAGVAIPAGVGGYMWHRSRQQAQQTQLNSQYQQPYYGSINNGPY